MGKRRKSEEKINKFLKLQETNLMAVNLYNELKYYGFRNLI
jgi:hypothetical protein